MFQQKQLGKDIIKRYQPYVNHHTKWTKTAFYRIGALQIYQQYQIIEIISEQPSIVAAKDKLANNQEKAIFAIKKMEGVFDHRIFAKKVLRSLKMLRLLKHENIVNIQTILLPKSRQQFKEIYVVYEMVDTDLTQILRSSQPLTQEHNKFFLYQLLRGLKYIHSANVAHRDIKPRNILISANCDLKICGFGQSRYLARRPKSHPYSSYISTRWYRAPEILFSSERYTTATDMWSVGCTFAEILLRRPFLAGSDTRNQIKLICEYFSSDVANLPNISPQVRSLIKKCLDDQPRLKDIRQTFSFAHPHAVDLLTKLLNVDPEKRITVVQALRHPYLQELHLQEDEPSAEQMNILQFQFQDYNLNNEQLKDMLYQQILLYHFEDFQKEHQLKKIKNQSLISHILDSSNSKNFDPYADAE